MTDASGRSRALDVFRGAAVALMILVNNPGSWQHLYAPLAHAPWHGCTPTDWVFPFFLFAVGNAMAFTMPALRAAPPAAFWAKVARRTALVFGIGLVLNASPFVRWDAAGDLVPRSLEQLRIMGVLQRIALAWCAAVLVVRAFGERGAALAAAALLLGYWAALHAFAQGPDPYSLEGFFGTHWDRALLGVAHLYRGEGVPFDPEGLASTLPAVAQVLLGYLAGVYMRRAPAGAAASWRLAATGVVALGLAALWQLELPLNKKIWTSSYVLHTTGIALLGLAALRDALDRTPAPRARWAPFFEVFGKNALAIFVLSGFVPRLLGLVRLADGVDAQGQPRTITLLPWIHRTLFEPLASDPRLASLLYALANLLVYWAIARAMDARRLYIRV